MQSISQLIYVCGVYFYDNFIFKELWFLFWCAVLSVRGNVIYTSTGFINDVITCSIRHTVVIRPHKLVFTSALEVRAILRAHCGDLDVGEVGGGAQGQGEVAALQ